MRHASLALPDAVAIDLDGTLLDTVPDLAAAADAMLAELGRPPAGPEATRRYVGNGIDRLVHRLLTGDMRTDAAVTLFDTALAAFKRHYAASNGVYSRVYPGVLDGLAVLAALGLPLACVTNKAAAFSEPLLASSGLARWFSLVVSGDTLEQKKPHPAQLLHVASHFGCVPARLLLIGDSVSDVTAARAAGCPVLCVSYGYNHGRPIGDESPDAVLDSLAVVARLLPAA